MPPVGFLCGGNDRVGSDDGNLVSRSFSSMRAGTRAGECTIRPNMTRALRQIFTLSGALFPWARDADPRSARRARSQRASVSSHSRIPCRLSETALRERRAVRRGVTRVASCGLRRPCGTSPPSVPPPSDSRAGGRSARSSPGDRPPPRGTSRRPSPRSRSGPATLSGP